MMLDVITVLRNDVFAGCRCADEMHRLTALYIHQEAAVCHWSVMYLLLIYWHSHHYYFFLCQRHSNHYQRYFWLVVCFLSRISCNLVGRTDFGGSYGSDDTFIPSTRFLTSITPITPIQLFGRKHPKVVNLGQDYPGQLSHWPPPAILKSCAGCKQLALQWRRNQLL